MRMTAPIQRATACVALVLLAACGGSGGGQQGPLYTTQQYSDSEIRSYTDLVYSTRPNEGEQFTDDETKSQELTAPTLSLRLDIHVPPDASATTPRPLLLWIHGGGL